MKKFMAVVRDSHAYAYVTGFCDRLAYGDGFGSTHGGDQDWNEAYDSGANLADRVPGAISLWVYRRFNKNC